MDSKRTISKIISPFLKESGFKKKGSTWYLINTEVIGIINIQKSIYSDLCYINIALCIVKDPTRSELPKNGSEFGYIRAENILSHEQSDFYNNILSFKNYLPESDDTIIIQLFKNHIVPFLKQYSKRSEIIRSIETKNEYWWKGLKNYLEIYNYL